MCGIVGYTGSKLALKPVLDGLKALEYRGYDSAGVTMIDGNESETHKELGEVENIIKPSQKSNLADQAHLAIGHTRWATHGEPSGVNAHPHWNNNKTIFVVHNGIIENYRQLKSRLEKAGYSFYSDTDTEVIPNLIDYHLKKAKNFTAAFTAAIRDLHGAYAIAACTTNEPENIYIARLSSPLVVGVGKNEHFVASDPNAMMAHTKKVIFLNDYDIAEISPKNIKITHGDPKQPSGEVVELDYDVEETEKGEYPHFMLKEIYEAPTTISTAIRGRVKPSIKTIKLGGLESVEEQLKFIERIVIVACGTSYYAGLVGEYLIEEIAGIPVEVQLASEFKYAEQPFSRSTALLAISQSGETADTIAAIKKVEGYGVLKLGIVNAVGSTIARITDAGVYCHAGPEQSVASTKAFIAQVTILSEIALYLANGQATPHHNLLKELVALPEKASKVLDLAPKIQKLAEKYLSNHNFLFIGRNYLYPCALEGALKLKEISYVHAEGCSAGEMKHGPLAMIDENFPTFVLALDSPTLEKTLSNMEEIKARKGPIIAIATEGNKAVAKLANDVIYIPKVPEQLEPLLAVIVMQLFAYYVAVEKGLNVDRPRNLAKSVTVE